MNRKIVVSVIVVSSVGVVNAWLHQKALTPVILGAYIFFFVLSIADMFGGPLSTISGGLAMLAVVYVVMTEVPWSLILQIVPNNALNMGGGLKNTKP